LGGANSLLNWVCCCASKEKNMYKGRVRQHAICVIEGMGNKVTTTNSFYLFAFEDKQMFNGPTFPLISN
jgi:hypothetical protein